MILSVTLLPGVGTASPAPSTGGITDGGFATGTFSAWTEVTSGTLTGGHSSTITLTSHDDHTGDPTYTLYDDVAVG